MLKGICIVATGSPFYGRYAYNLAVSIKAVEETKIAILWNGNALNHLSDQQKEVFDYIIQINSEANCGAKLDVYENSPFDHTLLFDADMLWLPERKPSELFKELEGVQFTAITEGNTDKPAGHYFFWANVDEIREKYKVEGVIYQWRTEVMYFEKGKVTAKLFKVAKKIYRNHGLKSVKRFALGVADEMAINIAAAIHGIEPHLPYWKPSYWPKMNRDTIPVESTLFREYYLLSLGGNAVARNTEKLYNRLMKAQAPKIGHSHLFALQSKFSFLKEREKS